MSRLGRALVRILPAVLLLSWAPAALASVNCDGTCADPNRLGLFSFDQIVAYTDRVASAASCRPGDASWARHLYLSSPARVRTQPKYFGGSNVDPVPAFLIAGMSFSGHPADRMVATFALSGGLSAAAQSAILSRCRRGQEIDPVCAMSAAYRGEAEGLLALSIGRASGYVPSVRLDRAGREHPWTLDELRFLHREISKLPPQMATSDPVILRKIPKNSCECESAPLTQTACAESAVAGCYVGSAILLKETKLQPQVLIHEIGHHIDLRGEGLRGFDSRFAGRHCYSSVYTAIGDVHETFAENFGDYLVSPAMLIDQCPAQFEFFRDRFFEGRDYLVSWNPALDGSAATEALREAAASCLSEVVSANPQRFTYRARQRVAGGWHAVGIFLTWFGTSGCAEEALQKLIRSSSGNPLFCAVGADGIREEFTRNLVHYAKTVMAREMKKGSGASGLGARLSACAKSRDRSPSGACSSFSNLP